MQFRASTLRHIAEIPLTEFRKYSNASSFPCLINRSTDLKVWGAKKSNSSLSGRVKYRVSEHLEFITDPCPVQLDKQEICKYLKGIVWRKIEFDLHSGFDFPVTEKHFVQLWIERLKEDEGYGQTLHKLVSVLSTVQNTLPGLIESIADALSLTDDPNAMINIFKQSSQRAPEESKSYVFRKMKEAKIIMQESGQTSQEIVEIVIRGMRD